ncbi:MAG: multidrug resistance efflux pump, partial [Verrucomicrobiales bacterium]|nr:multidrug resistance efflux pump [Verrucomicrobiales bacterium]
PLERVQSPAIPKTKNVRWVRNPIDAFVSAEHEKRGLKPRPEAPSSVLLRRVYLDLIGLSPTPEEQEAFEKDHSNDAYEKLVDRLLEDPRYGERWGRHWMDVWRYSDWAGWSGGNQIRDSKPHIWRWRDWIVESLNDDKGYDRMILEMLAADELYPDDENAVRATGFLARNYKMLSREQWLEDTVKHTSQAFLGTTVGCAKCHNHMTEPITQKEYYQMRAIFEPHEVRTDRLPGELDLLKNGLVRVYDVATNPPTWFYNRGDERSPDTNRVMIPAVPKALCADKLDPNLEITPVKLSQRVAHPDQRDFVRKDTIAASEKTLEAARKSFAQAQKAATNAVKLKEQELSLAIAEAKHAEVVAVIKAEAAAKDSEEWKQAAREAVTKQRAFAVAEAKLKMFQAQTAESEIEKKTKEITTAAEKTRSKDTNAVALAKAEKVEKEKSDKAAKDLAAAKKKTADAEKVVGEKQKELAGAPSTAYKPRSTDDYPEVSTGRRLAFAKWVANRDNPLTARVAMNHIWLRHFARGIVPTPADFGRNGLPASNPALLDWLASELMARKWSMKAMHRLILTSNTYRMSSTSDPANLKADPDDIYLWRMPSRRMEAEAVRDNLLYVTGSLDPKMGGPDIDNNLGLTSKRRSIYLRQAAEKEVEFLKIFDGPSVTECYQRRSTVMPQQALALANSDLALAQARVLSKKLSTVAGEDPEIYIRQAFQRVLARLPSKDEVRLCKDFLSGGDLRASSKSVVIPVSNVKIGRADPKDSLAKRRENLILILLNHNDFVTIR